MAPFPETLILIVSCLLTTALAFTTGMKEWVFYESLILAALFAWWVRKLRKSDPDSWPRWRFLAFFFYVWVYYMSLYRIVPGIGIENRDEALLAWDRFFFSETPSVFTENFRNLWLDDAMSVGYMCFHMYLNVVLICSLFESKDLSQRLWNRLGTIFALGWLGYAFVPAIGPMAAFPELYPADFAEGTLFITRLINWTVRTGSSQWDVFPSLHVLITLALLNFDYRNCRIRFWLFLIPGTGTIVSTVYLRYHYAIDGLVAIFIFGFLEAAFRRHEYLMEIRKLKNGT